MTPEDFTKYEKLRSALHEVVEEFTAYPDILVTKLLQTFAIEFPQPKTTYTGMVIPNDDMLRLHPESFLP